LVLVGIAAILIIAKLCGELFERIGQPAVLGELLGGIIVGNLLTPVIGSATLGAVVTMVLATTLVTPPLLKWALELRTAPKPCDAERAEGLDEILHEAGAEQIVNG